MMTNSNDGSQVVCDRLVQFLLYQMCKFIFTKLNRHGHLTHQVCDISHSHTSLMSHDNSHIWSYIV